MTVTATPLLGAKFIEATDATQFTAAGVTIIDAVSVTNVSAGVATLNLSIVTDGGSAGDVNRSIKSKLLRVGETYLCPEIIGQVLNVDDFVSAVSSDASALNIRISGRVIS